MRIVTLLVAMMLGGAHAAAQPFLYDLDEETPPAVPSDWVTTGIGWATSESSASPGSGGVNLAHSGSSAGSVDLPTVNLSGVAGGTFSFLARRTSSYPSDSLVVWGSIDGGSSFPFQVVAGADLPAASSTWQLVSVDLPPGIAGQPAVHLRIEGRGGTSGGSNVRIDDIRLEIEGGQASATLGFGVTELHASAGPAGAVLPIGVHMPEGLQAQGVQIDLSWTSDTLTFSAVEPGGGVNSTSEWLVESSEGAQSVRLLVIASGDRSIDASTAAPLVDLVFDVGEVAVSDTVTVSIVQVLLASATSEGSDLPYTIDAAHATLILLPRAGILEAPEAVDFGSLYADEILDDLLVVSNGSPSDSLNITELTVADSGWSLSPSSLVLAPGESSEIGVHFVPEPEAAGLYTAIATLVHGETSTPIQLSATVLPTLGDADGDRTIDVVDVLVGVDVVLGRQSPQLETLRRLDLFPYPAGDGEVDIRDLTVLIRAIVAGMWPDRQSLVPAAKHANPGHAVGKARLVFETVGEERLLRVVLPEEVRAVQAELAAARPAEAIQGFFASAGSVWAGPTEGGIRFLWLSLDGNPIGPGSYVLGRWPLARSPFGSVPIGEGVVAGTGLAKTQLVIGDVPDDTQFSLRPYPNPYHAGSGNLRLPQVDGVDQHGPIEIWDVLGRLVWRQDEPGGQGIWNGHDLAGRVVSPGVYFVRTGLAEPVYPFTVIR